MTNIYRILVDGQPPVTTWLRVGGDSSGLPMAMAMVAVSDDVHYIATAELESAFTAWLMLRGKSDTSSMGLGNAGKMKTSNKIISFFRSSLPEIILT